MLLVQLYEEKEVSFVWGMSLLRSLISCLYGTNDVALVFFHRIKTRYKPLHCEDIELAIEGHVSQWVYNGMSFGLWLVGNDFRRTEFTLFPMLFYLVY